MVRQFLLTGASIGALAYGGAAEAASCASRDTVVERLKSEYSEAPTAGGLQIVKDKHTLVEVWSSEETGSFTVMLTRPDGLTCIVATGTDWHQVDAPSDVKESKG